MGSSEEVFVRAQRSEARHNRKGSFSLWDPAFGVHDVVRECHAQLHETQIPHIGRAREPFLVGNWLARLGITTVKFGHDTMDDCV